MYKLSILFSILFLLLTVPLLAQEEPAQSMTLPQPLDDAFLKWMVGEWKGTTSSSNGITEDYMNCEMEIGGQFLFATYTANYEGKLMMSGLAVLTLDKQGNDVSYWIDSMREMGTGKGSRQGNVSVVKWPMYGGEYVRTTEKVDENTMKVTGVMLMPDGKEMKSETLLKRIK